jgi:hypothetical protein
LTYRRRSSAASEAAKRCNCATGNMDTTTHKHIMELEKINFQYSCELGELRERCWLLEKREEELEIENGALQVRLEMANDDLQALTQLGITRLKTLVDAVSQLIRVW